MDNKKVVGLLVVLFTLISVATAFGQAPFITVTPPASGTPPATYSFSVNWPAQTIQYVNWNFGDGSAPLIGSISTPNLTPSHTFNAIPATGNAYKVMAFVYSTTTTSAPTAPYLALVVSALGSPTVSINITPPASVVAPASYTFTATTSSGTITYVTWLFGDGTPPTGNASASITHNYVTAGTFYAEALEVDLSGGGFIVEPEFVVQVASTSPAATIIGDAPLTPFGENPQLPATFQAMASLTGGTISNVNWNFGDGTTSGAGAYTSITHTYSTAGNYNLTATITPTSGPAVTSQPVLVQVGNGGSLTGSLTSSQFSGTAGTTAFTFTPMLTGGSIAYVNYSFGNGIYANNVNTSPFSTTYTYPSTQSAGTYNVNATIVPTVGNPVLATTSITLTSGSGPTASVTFTPTVNIMVGTAVSFTASMTGGTLSYVNAWIFGDGTAPVMGSTATPNITINHTFSTVGSFNVYANVSATSGPPVTSPIVTVTVSTAAGGSATLSGTLTGTGTGSGPWTGSGSYTASAGSTTWSGSGTFIVGSSSGTWMGSGSFGVGTWSGSGTWSTSTGSGTWTGSGSFTGTTSGSWSGSGTWTQTTTAPPPPPPNPFITITPPASTTAPVPYSFGVQWPGQAIAYVNWNFGDGSAPLVGTAASPNINVSHTYNAPTVGNAFKVTATTDSGATATEFVLVTSASTPTVNLVVTPPASAVAPATYSFNVTTSIGTISSITWKFKDDMNNTSQPTFVQVSGATETYSFPYASTWMAGAVEVDLSGGGFLIAPGAKIQTAVASPAVTIIANTSPQPIMPDIGPILPLTGTLTAQLSGGGTISSVVWNFGDGSTAGTGTSTTHTYNVGGNYYVNATVTPTTGAAISSQSLLLNLTGGSPPPPPPPPGGGAGVPNISVIAPASPVAPATYSFTAILPNDTISSVSWNFADGSPTGTGVNINHTFTTPSTALGNVYNVLATMIDVAGATYTAQAPVTVTATAQPTAFINLTLPANLVAPATYSFTAVLQNDTNLISSVAWNFGDGSPSGSGTSTTHTYNVGGNFNVTATITDSASKSFFSQATASVFSSTAGGTATSAPIGFITVTPPAPPPAPQFFNFIANLSNDGSNTISSVAWNFGDGTTGTGVNVSHTYNVVGNFNVTATIIDSANKSISATAPIFLNAPPPPTAPPFISVVGMAPTNGIAPATATLLVNNVSASNSSTETWDFNDPFNPSTNIATGVVAGATVNHTFTRPGTYFVQATFTFSGAAAATTIYQPISIGTSVLPTGAPPIPSMTPVSGAITAGSTAVTFSLTNALAAYWIFGDGSPITGQVGASPATITTTHTYPFAGTFNVMIFGVGNDPTAGTFKIFMPMQVSVLPSLTATTTPIVTFNPTIPNAGSPVTLSVLNAASASWTTLGDGSVGGNGLTITHTYSIPGSYNVTVTGTDTSATHNSFSKTATLIVYPPPAANGPVNLVSAPPPIPLINLSSNGTTTGSTFFCNAPGINGKWNFGDPTSASNTATGNIASHQYNTAGNFTISYTANDPLGIQFTLTQLVVVGAATAATTTPIAAAPINTPNIGITMAPSGSLANGIVTFPSLPLTVSTANWDFGDGNTDTGLTPSKGAHTYTQAGTYIVKVTGTTTTGGTFNVSAPINIINIIQAAGVIAPIITATNVANAIYSSTTAKLITNTASIPFTAGGTTTTFTSNATQTTTAAGVNSLNANVTGITATGGITGLAGATITAASTNLTANAAPVKLNVTLPTGSNDQVVWNLGNGTQPITGLNTNFRPSTPGTYHPICTFTDPTTGKQSVVQMPDITIAAPANAPTFLTPTLDKPTPTAGDVVTVNATLTGLTSAVAYYRLNIDGKHRRIIKASEGQGAVGLNLRHRFEIATTHNIIVEAVLNDGTVIQSPTLSLTVTASATPPTITAGLTGGLVTAGATTLTQGNTTTFTFTPTAGTGSYCNVFVDYGNGVKHGKKVVPTGTPITFTTPPLPIGAFTPTIIVTNVDAVGKYSLDGVTFAGQTLYVNAPTMAIASIDATSIPKNVVVGTPITIPLSTANDGTNSTKGLQFRNGTTGSFTTIPPALITTTTASDGSTLLSFDPLSLINLPSGLTPASSTATTSFQIQATDSYTAGSSTGTITSAPVNLNLTTSTNLTTPPDVTTSSDNKTVNQKFDKDKDLNAHIQAGASSGGTAGATTFGISAPGGSVATATAVSVTSVAVTNYGNTAPAGVTPPDASLIPNPNSVGGNVVASYFSADYTYTDATVSGGAPQNTEPTQQTSISIDTTDNGDGTCTMPSGDKCNITTVTLVHQNPDTGKMESLSNVSVSESSDKKTVHISGNSSRNSPFALAGVAAIAAGGGGAGGGLGLGGLAAIALCGTTGFDAIIALALVFWMSRYLRRSKVKNRG